MILTPVSLWKDFDCSLDVKPAVLNERSEDGVKYEYVNFSGRDTGSSRVIIYGVLACSATNPSKECVLILQDSAVPPDEKLLAYFVKRGYSAFCVDYSGSGYGADMHTVYPDNVAYANISECRESMNTIGESALNTCWYEWVAVGAYSKKFLCERFATDRVGLIGIKDGGEIAWKLAYVEEFSCAVAVNACGWRTYQGIQKFSSSEADFNENNYKFLAGLDSQAYAQFVKCPFLLLCSTGDRDFNYDRAYDTFSRINPKFINSSSIAYSLSIGGLIDARSVTDLFMFLDSNVKKRYVFMPKPVEVSIDVDKNDNLIAKVVCDKLGIVESCGVLVAEDNYDFSTRNWSAAPIKGKNGAYECDYFLNVYEKSESVFAIGYAVYSNGFTVWSKICAKKISGRFRNSCAKSKIIFSSKFGPECFSSVDCQELTVGSTFLIDYSTSPKIASMCGLTGIMSVGSLMTSRIMCPQFAPDAESLFKLDVAAEKDANVTLVFTAKSDKDEYYYTVKIIGEVWQSVLVEAKWLKNKNGQPLTNFTACESVTVKADEKFAINNLMWL